MNRDRRQTLRAARRHFVSFLRDQRGTITVEMIIWLPMLTFWIVASIAYFDAYMSRNQAAKVAHTVSDIISRQEELSMPFLMQIDALQADLLTRASGASQLRLSSVQRTETGFEVRWSCVNDDALNALSPSTIPTNILPDLALHDSIVLTELFVPWDRFEHVVGLDDVVWTFHVVSRPRFTPLLELNGPCA